MSKAKVGVVGYGVIGMRLADGVALQEDMELVGIADVLPNLPLRAMIESKKGYDVYAAVPEAKNALKKAGISTKGTMDELLEKVDVMLDATPAGIGAKNKELYEKKGVKAIFQGGEKNDVADVFFHGYANYEKGIGAQFLKLTSCNTTGLIRAVDALDRTMGVKKIAITIIRRVADPGDTHRGIVDSLMIAPVPNHQAVDLMTIMPHVEATGLLVHAPVTHGHIISVVLTPKRKTNTDEVLETFKKHPRIRTVKLADGFNTNTALFNYGRFLGHPRGDMYEIGVYEEAMGMSGDDVLFTIQIPQESVVIPETIDGIRACTKMQVNGKEAVASTNKYLGME